MSTDSLVSLVQLVSIVVECICSVSSIRRLTEGKAVLNMTLAVICLAITSYIIFIYGDKSIAQWVILVLQFFNLQPSWRMLKRFD